jgi:hypothetical protein
MADRDPSEDERHIALGEVLRALGAELTAAAPDGLALDSATLELDVAVQAGPDGAPAFRVPTGARGGKRDRTARLALTLRSPGGAPPEQDVPAAEGLAATPGPEPLDTAAAAAPNPAAPERPPGLLDLLADTLRTLSEPGSRPAYGRSPWALPREGEDPHPAPPS